MKKIILDLATTLHGFIEGPNGETDWCIMDDDMDFDGFLSGIDTIFYGRVSYDAWGNYQPEENAGVEERKLWGTIHSKNKFVFSNQNREDENAVFYQLRPCGKSFRNKKSGRKRYLAVWRSKSYQNIYSGESY